MGPFYWLAEFLFILLAVPDRQGSVAGFEFRAVAGDSVRIDRDYLLETSMLGYYARDGARNPTLLANKGDWVRITIVNTELMTHDIVLEKMGVKSKVILEKGARTSILFKAIESDRYFCSIPGHRQAGMEGVFSVVEGVIGAKEVLGVRPLTQGGQPLNLNFETGNLSDWKAGGDAFLSPLSQVPTSLQEKDLVVGLEGKYFASSGGTQNSKRTGSLTSVSFRVSHPWASFLVSGGALQDTRVEIVLSQSNRVIFHITGQGRAALQPVVVDLRRYLNQNIYIRIIDKETGVSTIPYIPDDKWAHINFDDFRFHDRRPEFANELKAAEIIVLPPLDPVVHAGLSGAEAARVMTTREGFKVTLAAAEPAIVRPIAFTMDARGRLWVVEGHTYPVPAAEGEGKDRILIFEDTDGDGTLDSRKVFAEGLNLVSGIEIGMGGVWLGAAPYLLFIPLDIKNDKPAGPPQKLLDGWGTQDTHEVLNSLRWGPDGWLYGTHGVFTNSVVGKPGTKAEDRVKINGGVWRFHPVTQAFEVFAEGTSNPWGIDFNDYGHAFVTVCVIPHLYHVIQGGRYQRQAGTHFNPYIYRDIKTIADHVHWVGDRGPHAGNFRSGRVGGGHAHAGAMLYLGGSWPAEFRNDIFMNNINGARLNRDHLVRSGSGYRATHRPDLLQMNDTWSQWLNFRYDPSGSVFAIDWYDKNQCHSANPDVHDKTMGRIFKITHANDRWVQVDLSKATDLELVNYQLQDNEWYVRQARILLQERSRNPAVHKALKRILSRNPDVKRKLRALWTLHVTGGLTEDDLILLLSHQDEYLRSWAVQLLAEDLKVSGGALIRLAGAARSDSSALVRLYLAAALQRMDASQRWAILEGLLSRSVDRDDPNIPLMLWYALEPLASLDPARTLRLARDSKLPDILSFTRRRIAALKTPAADDLLREDNSIPDKVQSAPHHK